MMKHRDIHVTSYPYIFIHYQVPSTYLSHPTLHLLNCFTPGELEVMSHLILWVRIVTCLRHWGELSSVHTPGGTSARQSRTVRGSSWGSSWRCWPAVCRRPGSCPLGSSRPPPGSASSSAGREERGEAGERPGLRPSWGRNRIIRTTTLSLMHYEVSVFPTHDFIFNLMHRNSREINFQKI